MEFAQTLKLARLQLVKDKKTFEKTGVKTENLKRCEDFLKGNR